MKVAISGFRHSHTNAITQQIRQYPQLQIVAASESHPEACQEIIKSSGVTITHPSLDAMLDSVEFDALVIGDVFVDRGAQVIKALQAGKHILADKPLCTRLDEMEQIRALAKKQNRSVLVAFTLRYHASWQTARKMLRDGAIGTIATGNVLGQHGLNYQVGRPAWYFEKDRHGGTIVDLMVHGIDSLYYLTGQPVVEVIAARAWHVEPDEAPFFQDVAQAFFRLKNDIGITMEASYKTPRGHNPVWEIHLWGTAGDIVILSSGQITLRRHNEPAQQLDSKIENKTNIVEDFIGETMGLSGHQQELTTAESLDASEKAVLAQVAADKRQAYVKV
ncbi:MAG: Gfo/Idh/MocA family oxidoreductase [Planctomycetota bacterium]